MVWPIMAYLSHNCYMGIVHPNKSIIRKLKGAEKSFVNVLADGLSDSWSIFTRLDLWTPQRPFEIDVLLMHEKFGFLALEVKGGPVQIKEGEWYRREHHFDPSPMRQSQDAAYKLRDFLRDNSNEMNRVQIPHAVVLPDVVQIEGNLPTAFEEEMLFLNPAFENIEHLVTNCIYASKKKYPLTVKQISEFYRLVLPTVNFVWDPEARRRYSEDAITRISDEQIRALRSLDINDRVLVSGVAGSGKTRLALWWAHQSARAGKNTLLTCYNEPLGQYLQSVSSDYKTLTVGPFLTTVSRLPGIPKLQQPLEVEQLDHFWNVDMINHLLEHADQSETKFDTIVLDEFQDFNDEWSGIIEKLLADEYSKILCVADPNQNLYDRGFFMPEGNSPWAMAELRLNCRNTREIAALVRQFGGGPSVSASPEGEPVRFVTVSDETDFIDAVVTEVRRLISSQGSDISDMVVVTGTSAERNLFHNLETSEFKFCNWEVKSSDSVACETVKRAKGIEANHVIFATLNSSVKDNEIYVGISRARTELVIIGNKSLKDRFEFS
jgi:hypothetical protein